MRTVRGIPTPQTPSSSMGSKKGFNRAVLAVVIVVIVVAAVVIVIATALFIGPSLSVTTKNFAPYSTPVSQNSNNPSSLTVVTIDGTINVSPWTQSYLMINGTVTARGVGANPDTITFVESNSSGNIVFQAVFPAGSGFFFSTGYIVDINVYVPQSYHLNTMQATTVNGDVKVSTVNASSVTLTVTNGKLSASAVTATSLSVTDTNGSIDLTCSSCGGVTATSTNGSVSAILGTLSPTGSYAITSTNGSISLTVPEFGNYKITASATNGSVSSHGLPTQLTNHVQSSFGIGTATVTATTTNGSVTVIGI